MIPAYFWRATHAKGGHVSALPNFEGLATATEVAASALARWLLESSPPDMVMVEQCDLERNWPYEPTGHKAFDDERARSSGLMTGNVSSNVQSSFFVRPHSTTTVNGFTFEPGELRSKDLATLRGMSVDTSIPCAWLRDGSLSDTQSIIYCLHSHTSERDARGLKKTVVHGWVLTDDHHRLLRSAQVTQSPKSAVIMTNALKVFTCERINSVELLRIEDRIVQHVSDDVVDKLPPMARRLFDEFHAPTVDESTSTRVERGG